MSTTEFFFSVRATAPHRGSSALVTVTALCTGPHPQLVIFVSVSAAVDGIPVWPSAELQRCCHIKENLSRHWTTLTRCINWLWGESALVHLICRFGATRRFSVDILVFPNLLCFSESSALFCLSRTHRTDVSLVTWCQVLWEVFCFPSLRSKKDDLFMHHLPCRTFCLPPRISLWCQRRPFSQRNSIMHVDSGV